MRFTKRQTNNEENAQEGNGTDAPLYTAPFIYTYVVFEQCHQTVLEVGCADSLVTESMETATLQLITTIGF